jgi:hypothetical protein
LFPATTWSQNIGISTPRVGINDSFYERHGVSWGFQLGGPSSQVFGSFNQGSAQSAIPPFGGYDPASDAKFGFNVLNDNGSGWSLGLTMGKGSSRSMTGASPSIVVPNGGVGSIFDGSFRPFVTGVIPVVGNPGDGAESTSYPSPPRLVRDWSDVFATETEPRRVSTGDTPSTNYRSLNSTAAQGDLSIAEIESLRSTQNDAVQQEVEALIAETDAYEQAGKYSRARASLRKAIKRTEGRQRYDLQLRLESMLDK